MIRRYGTVIIAIALALAGSAGVWYLVARDPQPEKNTAQVSGSVRGNSDATPEEKLAGLTGEEFNEAYIADMLALQEGSTNSGEQATAASGREEIKELAKSIIMTRSQELAQMRSWQEAWGYEPTVGGHGGHGGTANETGGQVVEMGEALVGLNGEVFDRKFLELMIEHYEYVIKISKYAESNASRQELKDLAKTVIVSQEKEVAQMREWQKAWGY